MATLSHDREFERFCQGIQRLWAIDLRAYNLGQLERRLGGMMTRAGVETLPEFVRFLERNPELSAEYRDRFTINVTEFFRDTHLFARLEEHLKADGLSHRCRRVWSAACSQGMEPYSLVMILNDLAPSGDWRIEATDIDEKALEIARKGVYTAQQVRGIPAVRLKRYFDSDGSSFTVRPVLRERIRFSALDLLDPGGREPRGCDLVLCRNVVIYFTPEAKEGVYRLLLDSLRPGGLLFTGATERVSPGAAVGFDALQPFFYRKKLAA
jgi:chemotaxis protein methyltransferase CheR